MEHLLKLFVSFVLLALISLLICFYNVYISRPEKLRTMLLRQGIKGPKRSSIILGNIPDIKRMKSQPQAESVIIRSHSPSSEKNHGSPLSHNYAAKVFPYIEQWRNEYGRIFTYATGNIQHLVVTDIGVVKAMSLCTSLHFGRPSFMQKYKKALFGEGILAANGDLWAFQKKTIAPEFYMNKVKEMANIMTESITSLLESWEQKFDSCTDGEIYKEIRIDEDFKDLSAQIISRTCFGKNNYSLGKEIIARLGALLRLQALQGLILVIPGYRYLPIKSNREIWKLEKEISSLILKVVKERRESNSEEKDLLATLLDNSGGGKNFRVTPADTQKFIIDNCKNIYIAGSETTATTSMWVMVLLASNQEWQERVRVEAQEICKGSLPDDDMLSKMKLLTMVIHEALRLYPSGVFLSREATQDMSFGDLTVPKGVIVSTPVLAMHNDPNIWGPNALEFEPERFANGIAGACKFPQAYMPFGFGSRICLGQNFSMVEMKILLSQIVSKFSFSLSPKYKHSPVHEIVIIPEHEVVLLVKRV